MGYNPQYFGLFLQSHLQSQLGTVIHFQMKERATERINDIPCATQTGVRVEPMSALLYRSKAQW